RTSGLTACTALDVRSVPRAAARSEPGGGCPTGSTCRSRARGTTEIDPARGRPTPIFDARSRFWLHVQDIVATALLSYIASLSRSTIAPSTGIGRTAAIHFVIRATR